VANGRNKNYRQRRWGKRYENGRLALWETLCDVLKRLGQTDCCRKGSNVGRSALAWLGGRDQGWSLAYSCRKPLIRLNRNGASKVARSELPHLQRQKSPSIQKTISGTSRFYRSKEDCYTSVHQRLRLTAAVEAPISAIRRSLRLRTAANKTPPQQLRHVF